MSGSRDGEAGLQARIESIFRAAPIGIGLVAPGRIIVEGNQRLCELTGYALEELLGQPARMLYFSDEEYERVGREEFAEIALRGTGAVETRWRRRDGSEVPILLSSSPLDPAAPERGTTFTALDLTGRKQLEAQVLHAQKLESLGVLAGGIAHDFNNLLVAILGNADLARTDLPAGSPVADYLLDIETAARRAADFCRQLLAYAGKGRYQIELCDLSLLCAELGRILEVSVSKRATLRYDLSPGLPPVEADATQLRQVMMNLITNASEAVADRGGEVVVRTGSRECDAAYLRLVQGAELTPGRYLFLEVSDTGCGMDATTRAHLFDPFFSTKFTGRGLGMAAVFGIVRSHHGGIEIESSPGQGTRVTVLFPPKPGVTASALPRVAGAESPAAVLLVDDEETVRTVGRRMLERLGFRVLLARDGEEAVASLRAHPEVGCVILDLTMPGLDGVEAFRALRQIRAEVPIVLSSGYSEQEVTTRFRGEKLAGYLQKPYQLEAIQRIMASIKTLR
jgi:PAS domain S-box-containing protein